MNEVPVSRIPQEINEEYAKACGAIGDTEVKLRRAKQTLEALYLRIDELEAEMRTAQAANQDGEVNGNV